jgi:hypothetical protein
MLVLIISYKKNGEWNEMKEISENRFKQLGYKTKTIQMEKLERELYKNTPQHLDGFLSKNMNLKIELLDWENQKKEKYVEEIEHYSTTIGKIRKGIKINN